MRKAFHACSILVMVAFGLGCFAAMVVAEENPPLVKETAVGKAGNALGGEANRAHRKGGKKGKEGKGRERPFPPPKQAWSVATIILGCPSDRKINLSITTVDDLEGYIEYGKDAAPFSEKSETRKFTGGSPVLVSVDGLVKDTAYNYRFRYRTAGESDFKSGPDCHFHTQRAPGSSFTFEIQGDSHPERSPKQMIQPSMSRSFSPPPRTTPTSSCALATTSASTPCRR